MSGKKAVTFTLPKDIAERIGLVRKFKHRKLNVVARLNTAIEDELEKLEAELKLKPTDWKHAKKCPVCTSGTLIKRYSTRHNNKVAFLSCNRFPSCRYTESL